MAHRGVGALCRSLFWAPENAGLRCGVYTLVSLDVAAGLKSEADAKVL